MDCTAVDAWLLVVTVSWKLGTCRQGVRYPEMNLVPSSELLWQQTMNELLWQQTMNELLWQQTMNELLWQQTMNER
jgi:hypothetical protein